MSAKIINLYNMVKAGDPKVAHLTITVAHNGPDGQLIVRGFLEEDINLSVSNTFSTSIPDIPIVSGVAEKAENAANTALQADGSGVVVNPLNLRKVFQGSTTNGFKVDVNLLCLDGNDIISEAKKVLRQVAPQLNNDAQGMILKAPGGYNFPLEAGNVRAHANNTWTLIMGKFLSVPHLVCNGVDMTISKEVVRTPAGHQPLYIKLSFDLEPDRLVYGDELENYVNYNPGIYSETSVNNGGLASMSSIGDAISTGYGIVSNAIKSGAENLGQATANLLGFGNNEAQVAETSSQKPADNHYQNAQPPSGA